MKEGCWKGGEQGKKELLSSRSRGLGNAISEGTKKGSYNCILIFPTSLHPHLLGNKTSPILVPLIHSFKISGS